jgi:hypothetical protein
MRSVNVDANVPSGNIGLQAIGFAAAAGCFCFGFAAHTAIKMSHVTPP